MKKAQLQITIINAVIASLSTLNIKQEVILYIQSNIIILLVLTFVSFRNNQQSNVVVNVLKELLMFISSQNVEETNNIRSCKSKGDMQSNSQQIKKQKKKQNEKQ